MAALAFMAGCGPQFMAARWAGEIELWTGVALAAARIRAEEAEALARMVRNQVMDGINGKG